ILDRQRKIPVNSAVFSPDVKTIVLTGMNGSDSGDRSHELPGIIFREIDFSRDIGRQICKVLFTEEIQSVIIEGGSKTLQTFIDEDLWDEARIFTGKETVETGIKAPEFSGKFESEEKIASDTLKIYSND
ncbi:MAG TPA: riboflavin biosynthesis protein RibD, partial [Salinimicrobium sp.]|nr:riboflavin biosynthesis protein RibD [Salinimicrobium sp.]